MASHSYCELGSNIAGQRPTMAMLHGRCQTAHPGCKRPAGRAHAPAASHEGRAEGRLAMRPDGALQEGADPLAEVGIVGQRARAPSLELEVEVRRGPPRGVGRRYDRCVDPPSLLLRHCDEPFARLQERREPPRERPRPRDQVAGDDARERAQEVRAGDLPAPRQSLHPGVAHRAGGAQHLGEGVVRLGAKGDALDDVQRGRRRQPHRGAQHAEDARAGVQEGEDLARDEVPGEDVQRDDLVDPVAGLGALAVGPHPDRQDDVIEPVPLQPQRRGEVQAPPHREEVLSVRVEALRGGVAGRSGEVSEHPVRLLPRVAHH
mmetsp:Transcript_147268/g.455556  ORF Transcript_147268/g.455556 Transcript_147268/m.455556 type:complete len:319 (+) Transcript_147268:161-1117(+)